MNARKLAAPMLALILALIFSGFAPISSARAQAPAAQNAASRPVGTVKAISGNAVTMTTDAGAELTVNVQDSTRLVKTAPGQKDLTGATAIQLKDLQVGDRILVRGTPSADSKSIAASAIIVMKKSDIEQKQAAERADWQKRGVGGLVTAVDPASGTITISSAALSGNKSVAIHTSKETVIRRYASDSIKFDDAKLATLDQIQVGDQLRARGDRNPEGTELNAQEIVSGSFRNIAGTVISTDAAAQHTHGHRSENQKASHGKAHARFAIPQTPGNDGANHRRQNERRSARRKRRSSRRQRISESASRQRHSWCNSRRKTRRRGRRRQRARRRRPRFPANFKPYPASNSRGPSQRRRRNDRSHARHRRRPGNSHHHAQRRRPHPRRHLKRRPANVPNALESRGVWWRRSRISINSIMRRNKFQEQE